MSLTQIIDGHLKEFLDQEKALLTERKKICDGCKLLKKDKILGDVCNKNKWLNPITDEVSDIQKDNFYNGCGCRLNAKRRIPEASCPLNK